MYAAMLWRIIPGTKFTPNLYLSPLFLATRRPPSKTEQKIRFTLVLDSTKRGKGRRRGRKEEKRREGGEREEKQLSSRGENWFAAKISRKIRSSFRDRRSRARMRGTRRRRRGGIARGNTCRRSMNASSVFAYPLYSPAFLPPPPPSPRSFCTAITPQRPRIARARRTNKGEGGIMNVEKGRRAGSSFRDETVGQLTISVSRTLRIFTLGISVSDLGEGSILAK